MARQPLGRHAAGRPNVLRDLLGFTRTPVGTGERSTAVAVAMAKSTSPSGRIALGAVLAGGMAIGAVLPSTSALPVGAASAALVNPPAVDAPTGSVLTSAHVASGIPGRAEELRDDADRTPGPSPEAAQAAAAKAAAAKAAAAKAAAAQAAAARAQSANQAAARLQASRSAARAALIKAAVKKATVNKATVNKPTRVVVKTTKPTTTRATTTRTTTTRTVTVSRTAVRKPTVAPVVRTGGYVIGNDYPGYYGTDPFRFTARQCTSFVAWRLNSRNGVAFNVFYRGVKWGNASNWGYAARSVGIRVDSAPARGAVAWSSAGHVAWVSRVNGDGTVTIEEFNWNYDRSYHTRTVPVSKFRYIHIADL